MPAVARDFVRPLRAVAAENEGSFAPVDWGLLASVALIWGSSFLLIAIGLDALAPETITLLRVASGAAILAAWGRRDVAIDPLDRPRVVALSVLWVALPFTLFPIAQQHINSALTGLLNGATPIFVGIVATVFVKQAPRGRLLLGLAVGFLGVVLISVPSLFEGSSEFVGVALVLLATVCYGVAINVAAPLQARYGSVALMGRVLVLATIWVTPLGLWGLRSSSFEIGPVVAVLVLGVVGTGIAFGLMASLVGRVGSTRASIATYLIPVVALGLGVVFRDDDVAALSLVGVAFVLVGAALASRRGQG